MASPLQIRDHLQESYADVYTAEALAALTALAPLDVRRRERMAERLARRRERAAARRPLAFLDPDTLSSFERRRLKDAFGVVQKLQQVLSQRYTAGRF